MKAEYIIICEDLQTEVFTRNFLLNRGVLRRKIVSKVCPSGQQSGEQWVRQQFPGELLNARARPAVKLIVIIDADTGSDEDRRNQLNRECLDRNVALPSPSDSLLILVPKRNIETWFAYLRGEDVDEKKSHPKYRNESECKPQAKELYRMCHQAQKLRPPAPPSLKKACKDYSPQS